MAKGWVILLVTALVLAVGADQSSAQLFGRKSREEAPPAEPKTPLVTAPLEIARISEGVQFKSYIGVVDELLNETIVAQGACVIVQGPYRKFPRVAGEIKTAAAAGVLGTASDAEKLLTTLLQFAQVNRGDVHCRIERGTETGCVTDLCVTAKPFNSYLVSYGANGKLLGSGADACGGSIMRSMDDCEPKVVGVEGSAPAGFAVCVEAEIAMKGSKEDQVSSVVIGYGKVPSAIKAQMAEGKAVQTSGCEDRGFSAG